MNLRTLTSTAIKSVAFEAGDLFVAFTNGGVYRFDQVPSWVFAGFFRAKSAGRYFRKCVMGRYPSARVA